MCCWALCHWSQLQGNCRRTIRSVTFAGGCSVFGWEPASEKRGRVQANPARADKSGSSTPGRSDWLLFAVLEDSRFPHYCRTVSPDQGNNLANLLLCYAAFACKRTQPLRGQHRSPGFLFGHRKVLSSDKTRNVLVFLANLFFSASPRMTARPKAGSDGHWGVQ